jgi:hypothetical protein
MAEDIYSRAIARIGVTTIVLALAASTYLLVARGWRSALALLIGAALAWINFRWLKGGVTAISVPATNVTTGAATETSVPVPAPKVPVAAFAKFIGRFALLLGVVYVILSSSLLPATPLFAGLFTTVAAALVQMIFLLGAGVRPAKRR